MNKKNSLPAGQHRIVQCPTKAELGNSLFQGTEVDFEIQHVGTVTGTVQSIEREDSSNNSWNVRVYFRESDPQYRTLYCSTMNHKGTVQLEDKQVSQYVPGSYSSESVH